MCIPIGKAGEQASCLDPLIRLFCGIMVESRRLKQKTNLFFCLLDAVKKQKCKIIEGKLGKKLSA